MEHRRINLTPFKYPLLDEIILNIVIFIPLGIYVGVLFKRFAWISKILFFFILSLALEGFQFIFKIGAFDITDIIANGSGGVIGFMVFQVIERIFNTKSQTVINAFATIATVLVISLLLLLKLNMLPIRYR